MKGLVSDVDHMSQLCGDENECMVLGAILLYASAVASVADSAK